MDECAACGICKKKCVVGAISDSPVINADLCINKYTYRLDPVPEHVPTEAFNALIGCWLCQASCPANPVLPEGAVHSLKLDDAETRAFLAYDTPMPPELHAKLGGFFKNEHLLSVAGRNAALALRNIK